MSLKYSTLLLLIAWIILPVLMIGWAAPQAGTAYYVSSSSGNDGNNGLSEGAPFASVSKVNSLSLQPDDQVLFKCGDVWRVDPLNVTRSGSAGHLITFDSYPSGCLNQPILSGTQPVAGWTPYSGSIYVADLSGGSNAGKFTNGINQLFRDGQRLILGRWPNLDSGNGGYSTIDSQSSGTQFTDAGLPTGNWTGAVAHIRGMRWYILNRHVTGDSGSTLTLGANSACWGSSCAGWGYFLNGHLNALDQDGEWFYDAATHRVYLYNASGIPVDGQVEGSVIWKADDRAWGGVNLGLDLNGSGISHVVVENLAIRAWFRHGVASPTNLAGTENHDVIVRDNTIQDVDSIGVSLMTWVYSATDGRPDGWRGGYNITIQRNTVERANRMGMNIASRASTIQDNTIRDVGMIENLGEAGMGCDYDDGEGQCTEDGDGIRIKVDRANDSGNSNTISGNHLERIGYNGMDIFGYQNTVEHNLIQQACYSKGDCGGVRTFGSTSLAQTNVHDLLFRENIIVDTIGNTDGCATSFQSLFGFGFYIDNYSRDITITGNTVIGSTVHGILYQNSTGQVTGNTLYDNSRTATWSGQVWLTAAPTSVTAHTDNILFGLNPGAWTLSIEAIDTLGSSDHNRFFSPYRANHIRAGGNQTLSSWQNYSGEDEHSSESWYTQSAGEPARSHIFYNASSLPIVIDLGTTLYQDLDQNTVFGSLSLEPYHSRILIENGQILSLTGISPALSEAGAAADFNLVVSGFGFTPNSIVRWNGNNRPTTYESSTRLVAEIPASDVSVIGDYPVTVYDPAPPPSGGETSQVFYHVVESVLEIYLPSAFR